MSLLENPLFIIESPYSLMIILPDPDLITILEQQNRAEGVVIDQGLVWNL